MASANPVGRRRFRSRREGGQAMVESAIVLPMYVFLMLGILQLGLAHQARTLTKYAAYKAARAGALNNASVKEMRKAALGVLLPNLSSAASGAERIQPTDSVTSYDKKWLLYQTNRMADYWALRYVDVTICGPTTKDVPRNAEEIDFDDPRYSSPEPGERGWADSLVTKLRVQVTYNYRMPIPFANAVLHAFVYGRETTKALRMEKGMFELPDVNVWAAAASRDIYVMPIRANYNMRMMSNIYVNKAPLPESNKCAIPFAKNAG